MSWGFRPALPLTGGFMSTNQFNIPLDTGHFGDESFQRITCMATLLTNQTYIIPKNNRINPNNWLNFSSRPNARLASMGEPLSLPLLTKNNKQTLITLTAFTASESSWRRICYWQLLRIVTTFLCALQILLLTYLLKDASNDTRPRNRWGP